MRRQLLLILILTAATISAQDSVYEGRWHENILTVRWGAITQYDEYLTPLKYKGQFLALQNEWWQPFAVSNDWQHVGKLKLQGARTYNPTYSNLIYALGVHGGWGAHYDFHRLINLHGLNLFVGSYIDFDLFAKELINNVNKPYSADAAVELRLHAGISYGFAAKNTSYRLRYTMMTGFLGVQFVPEYGQSYYEITEGIIGGTVGLSSLHNKMDIRHELTIDMQFRHSAWRIGVEHEYINNSMNGLGFQREQVSLIVGTLFNYKTAIRRL